MGKDDGILIGRFEGLIEGRPVDGVIEGEQLGEVEGQNEGTDDG